MNLELQIQTLSYSIFFGMFFSLIFNLSYFVILKKNKCLRYVFSIMLMIILSTIYFYLLLEINEGVLNKYLFIGFIIGVIIGNLKTKKLRKP